MRKRKYCVVPEKILLEPGKDRGKSGLDIGAAACYRALPSPP